MATPTTRDRQHYALQTIFSFFLGLMVLAFVGVGVNTFYPSPSDKQQTEEQAIQRQMDTVTVSANGRALDTTQQAEMDRLTARRNALQSATDVDMKGWMRNTSIVLVIFATLVMSVSLVRSEQLRVLSNGLLLGGLFTMLYGTGWVIFSGNSGARFAVITFALLVAIGLGYVKFVRDRAAAVVGGVPADEGATGSVAIGDVALFSLAERVSALEKRAAAAAAALGGEDSDDRSREL